MKQTTSMAAIEKRIRKNARLNRAFSAGDRILITDNNSKESEMNKYLVPRVIKDLPAKIFACKTKKANYFNNKKLNAFIKKHKINKVVLPTKLDQECCDFLDAYFQNKRFNGIGYKIKKGNTEYVKLLRNITEEECRHFAKQKKLKYKENKKGKNQTNIFLQELSKKHPEIKFSLLKSMDEITQ